MCAFIWTKLRYYQPLLGCCATPTAPAQQPSSLSESHIFKAYFGMRREDAAKMEKMTVML